MGNRSNSVVLTSLEVRAGKSQICGDEAHDISPMPKPFEKRRRQVARALSALLEQTEPSGRNADGMMQATQQFRRRGSMQVVAMNRGADRKLERKP